MEIQNNPESDMLKQVREARESAKHTAKTGEGGNPNGQADELPEGSSPLEAREETTVVAEGASEEAPEASEGESATTAPPAGEEEQIVIGDQVFTSEAEAIKYARKLEQERLLTEAHSAGIREALEATRVAQAPTPEPEDDFESRFYANPKETLKEVKSSAVAEAKAEIRAEMEREKQWNLFLEEYPDIRRKDAERVLNENIAIVGKLNLDEAKKVIARKVRAEYDEIVQLTKPRVELGQKRQTQSPGGTAPRGVTQQTKSREAEKPLSFAQQMKATFKR